MQPLSLVCVPHLVTVVAAEDKEELFLSCEEFLNFFKIGGTDQVSQYARPLWDAGHRSCRSVADVKLETLEDKYGADVRHCHSFCKLRIGHHTTHIGVHHANHHSVPWRLCFTASVWVTIILYHIFYYIRCYILCYILYYVILYMFVYNLCGPLKELVLQTWTHVLSCFDQHFQSQRCQPVLLALIRLSSPGHVTLTSWKHVMLLQMFWNTLVACIPPRSGLRQWTLSTSRYV